MRAVLICAAAQRSNQAELHPAAEDCRAATRAAGANGARADTAAVGPSRRRVRAGAIAHEPADRRHRSASLSEVEAAEPVVISLFLDLDPAQFATAPARASQITVAALATSTRAIAATPSARTRRGESLTADRERLEALPPRRGRSTSTAPARSPSTRPTRSTCSRPSSSPEPVDAAATSTSARVWSRVHAGAQDEGAWCVLLVTRDIARASSAAARPACARSRERALRRQEPALGRRLVAGALRALRRAGGRVDISRRPPTCSSATSSAGRSSTWSIGANNESLRPALAGETHSYLRRAGPRLGRHRRALARARRGARGGARRHGRARGGGGAGAVRAPRRGAGHGRRAPPPGLDDVLAALSSSGWRRCCVREGAEAARRQVRDLRLAGRRRAAATCPVDETALDDVDNIVEPAIQAAVQQSARRPRAPASDECRTPRARRFDGAGRGTAALLSARRGGRAVARPVHGLRHAR